MAQSNAGVSPFDQSGNVRDAQFLVVTAIDGADNGVQGGKWVGADLGVDELKAALEAHFFPR